MNINLPTLKSTYFGIYNSEEEYNKDLDDRKEELNEAFFAIITDGDDSTPNEYQYSIRTTNNDNKILGKYNENNKLVQAAFYPTVFGVLGWTNTVVEYDGEQLNGGYFTNYVTTYEIPYAIDTWKLKNIDYFLYYLPEVNKIAEIDLSNVVTANYAFGKENNRTIYIDGIEKFTDFPNLKSAKYFLSNWHNEEFCNQNLIYNMPKLVDGDYFFDNFVFYNTNNIKLNAPNINLNYLFNKATLLVSDKEIDMFGTFFVTPLKTNHINKIFNSAIIRLQYNNSHHENIPILIYDFDKWFDLEEGTIINIDSINNLTEIRCLDDSGNVTNNITVAIKIISTKYKLHGGICLGYQKATIVDVIMDDMTRNNIENLSFLNWSITSSQYPNTNFPADVNKFNINNVVRNNYKISNKDFFACNISATGTLSIASEFTQVEDIFNRCYINGDANFVGFEYIDNLDLYCFKQSEGTLHFKLWKEDINYTHELENYPNYRKVVLNDVDILYIDQTIVKLICDRNNNYLFKYCDKLDFSEHECEIHIASIRNYVPKIFFNCNNLKKVNIILDGDWNYNRTSSEDAIIYRCNAIQDITITLSDNIIDSSITSTRVIFINVPDNDKDITNLKINIGNNDYRCLRVLFRFDKINSINYNDLYNIIEDVSRGELYISEIAYNKFNSEQQRVLNNSYSVTIVKS